MNVPRSVADVLSDHVVFEVDCIDRMYCNVYIPGLQYAAGLVGYVHQQLGLPIASTAPLAKISDRFSAAVHHVQSPGTGASICKRILATTQTPPAVNIEHDACDEGSATGCEKCHRFGNLFGLSWAFQ